MDRKDFYYRQRVTQAELDEAWDKAEQADRDLVSEVMGYGFLIDVTYPATVTQASTPDLTVLAAAFLGYDQSGRRVCNLRHGYLNGSSLGPATPTQIVDISVDEVGANTIVAGVGNEKTISIFVEFERSESDPRTDGNSATVYFDQQESIKFNVVQSAEAGAGLSVPPPLRSDQLLLCDITRVYGATAITNSEISTARQQAFALGFTHGATHVETGTDPVPNATTSVGGLLSAVDKTKLDAITFTASGVGALLQTFGSVFQPANVTAPAAVSLDVTSAFSGKSAGGDAASEGVVTQSESPRNRVILTDDNDDQFVDTSGGRNDGVYGEIEVDNEGAPTVWTLKFYTNQAGVKTAFDMTPFAGSTIKWAVQEMFLLHNLPSFNPLFTIPSDQVAAEFPYPIKAEDSGGSTINVVGFSHLKEGSNITFTDGGSGRLVIDAPAAPAALPVGSVIMWLRATTATAIPTDYSPLDGSVVSDAGSPFNGMTLPDIQDGFPRGLQNTQLATYAVASTVPTGGANTHAHTINTVAAGSHQHGGNTGAAAPGTDSQGSHNHGGTVSYTSTKNAATPGPGGITGPGLGPDGHDHQINSDGAHTHTVSSHAHTVNSDGNHSHSASATTESNVPGFVQLLFLIKIK